MNHGPASRNDAAYLEDLWRGSFGEAYVDRNKLAGVSRAQFWSRVVDDLNPNSVLEIGTNVGGNLRHLVGRVQLTAGVDVNTTALTLLKERLPPVLVAEATGRALPFPDESFDLVFTVGVLIHVPDDALGDALDEMTRCSRRHVLVAEYHSDEEEVVPYRGQERALFKRDYAMRFLERYPKWGLIKSGHLSPDEGFDDVTYQIFARS
ncbi:MAG: methyltransferase domain-containing protein [Actinomycetota bacterium]|nr:methyltransferase domain-containing protein [Actinomycetota bacterium]